MITVSLKHLGIPAALEIVGIYISTQELEPQILEVLQAIFLRIDALLRRLQVITLVNFYTQIQNFLCVVTS